MGKLLPAMTQQKLDTQRDVVKNERRWSMDNQPYGTLVGTTAGALLSAGASVPSFADRLDGATSPRRASTTSRSSSRRTTRPTTRCSRSPATSIRDEARRLVERHFGRIPRGAGKPPLPDMSLPPMFGAVEARGRAGRRHAAAALPRVPLAGVRQRRVLRGERVRRDPRPEEGQPLHRRSCASSRSRPKRRRSPTISRRGATCSSRRDGAAGDDARAARAGSRARESIASLRDGVTADEVERAVALIETEFDRRRCSQPASAPTSSRCSRRTSATRRS